MADWLTSVRDALADSYEFREEIGRGGMATVHLALDLKHQRSVAIKMLRAELTSPVVSQRFLREIHIIAQLQHPHILPLFDSGQAGGVLYYVMPYAEGGSLRRRLRAEPQLPLTDALGIARDVAGALAYAHARGVVHRDIKPENILISGEHAVLADFGVARALGDALEGSGTRLTAQGLAIGTPSYMSPEQLLANEEVDAQTDVYSLGCVLFEALAGCLPFERGAPALHRRRAPLQLSAARADVPFGVERAVERALATDRHERWASVADFAAALVASGATAPLEMDAPTVARARSTDAHADGTVTAPAGGAHSPPAAPGAGRLHAHRRVTVGREQELALLRQAFDSVLHGQGLLISVAGEPGIGKTTLVAAFLAHLEQGNQPYRSAQGRCSERFAGAAAYLPILEALDSVLQEDAGGGQSGGALPEQMRLLAPSWYSQVVRARQAGSDTDALGLPQILPPSQERLSRELLSFLQEASRSAPLVISIDDVHWADASTVDILTYLAGRFDTTRVLIVATCRQSELLLARHPFAAMKLDLQARGLCREIVLPFLTREDVEKYLSLSFPGHDFPPEFPALIHEKTEGSPLFMAELVRYLADRGAITGEPGSESLARPMVDIGKDVPESVRSMVQRKVEQLAETDRRLLVVGAVQGNEFDAAVIARVLQLDQAEVEERLATVERVHAFVRLQSEREYPNRNLTARYRFVHVLYQNALYAALTPARRAGLSASVAQALLGFHRGDGAAIAAELAILFETARDAARAAEHFLRAARNALKVFANVEAIALARRGLEQVEHLPPSPERAELEMSLYVTLGFPLMAVKGYSAADVEQAFNRAQELCEELGARASRFPTLWGLWGFSYIRGELERARELAGHLFQIARSTDDSALLIQAHLAMGMTLALNAELAAALKQLDLGIGLYDPQKHRAHSVFYGHDPAVVCMSMSLWMLWLLGYPDQAIERARRLERLATELAHPQSLAFALHFIGSLYQLRGEPSAALEHAEAAVAVATEHNLVNWKSWASVVRGWAIATLGDVDRGVEMIRAALVVHRAMGAGTSWPHFTLLLAESLSLTGQFDEALSLLDEGLAAGDRTGERWRQAELHRFKGELLARRSPADADKASARASVQRGLEMARRQGARSLELRATLTLCHLHEGGEEHAAFVDQLAEIHGWFTEGADTRDQKEARRVLSESGRLPAVIP